MTEEKKRAEFRAYFYRHHWSIWVLLAAAIGLWYLVRDLPVATTRVQMREWDASGEWRNTFVGWKWMANPAQQAARDGFLWAALYLASVCGVAVFHRPRTTLTDAEIDGLLREDVERVAQHRAVEVWGISPEQLEGDPPVTWLVGPTPEAFASLRAERKGADGARRFSPVSVSVFGFGKDQLFTYMGTLDLRTGTLLHERTREFFYDDVVATSRETASLAPAAFRDLLDLLRSPWTLLMRGLPAKYVVDQTFVLVSAGGIEVRMPIDATLDRQLAAPARPPRGPERAIASVRAMLRDKKRSPELLPAGDPLL